MKIIVQVNVLAPHDSYELRDGNQSLQHALVSTYPVRMLVHIPLAVLNVIVRYVAKGNRDVGVIFMIRTYFVSF